MSLIPIGKVSLPGAWRRFVQIKYYGSEPYGVLRYHCRADGLAHGVDAAKLVRRQRALDAAYSSDMEALAGAFASGELIASCLVENREVQFPWPQVAKSSLLFSEEHEVVQSPMFLSHSPFIGATPYIDPVDIKALVSRIRQDEFEKGMPRQATRLLAGILLDVALYPSEGVSPHDAFQTSKEMAAAWGLPPLDKGIIRPVSEIKDVFLSPGEGNVLSTLSETGLLPSTVRQLAPPMHIVDTTTNFLAFDTAALVMHTGKTNGEIEVTDDAREHAPRSLTKLLNDDRLDAEGKRDGLFEPMRGCWHEAQVLGCWLNAPDGNILTAGFKTWSNVRLRTADVIALLATRTGYPNPNPIPTGALPETPHFDKHKRGHAAGIEAAIVALWPEGVPAGLAVSERNGLIFREMLRQGSTTKNEINSVTFRRFFNENTRSPGDN